MLKLDKIFVTSSIDVLSIDIAWWLLNLIMTLIIKFEYPLPDMRDKRGGGGFENKGTSKLLLLLTLAYLFLGLYVLSLKSLCMSIPPK